MYKRNFESSIFLRTFVVWIVWINETEVLHSNAFEKKIGVENSVSRIDEKRWHYISFDFYAEWNELEWTEFLPSETQTTLL